MSRASRIRADGPTASFHVAGHGANIIGSTTDLLSEASNGIRSVLFVLVHGNFIDNGFD